MGNSTPSQFRLQHFANRRIPSSLSAGPSSAANPANPPQCQSSAQSDPIRSHPSHVTPLLSNSRFDSRRDVPSDSYIRRQSPRGRNRKSDSSDSATSGSILSKDCDVNRAVSTDFLRPSGRLQGEEYDEINPDDFINSDSDECSGTYANQISDSLLTKSLPKLQQDIEALAAEVSRQISEVSKAREKKANCEQQLDTLRLSFKENEELRKSADQSVKRAAQENAILAAKCNQLQEKLASLRSSADVSKLKQEELQNSLRDEIHELTATIREKDALLATKDETLEKVEQELNYAKGNFESEVVKRESLACEKVKLDKQVSDLNEQVANLQQAISKEEKRSASVAEKQEQIVAVLENEKSQQNAKVDELQTSVRNAQTENLRHKKIITNFAKGIGDIRELQNGYTLSVSAEHSNAGLKELFVQLEKHPLILVGNCENGNEVTELNTGDDTAVIGHLNSIMASLQKLFSNSASREQVLIGCILEREATSIELLSSLRSTVELWTQWREVELEVQKALNEAQRELQKLRESLGKIREHQEVEKQRQAETSENQIQEREKLRREVESHCSALDEAKERVRALERQNKACLTEWESCKRAGEHASQQLKDSQSSLKVSCMTRVKLEQELCALEQEKDRLSHELDECKLDAKNARDEVLYVTEMVHRSTLEAGKEKQDLIKKVETITKDLEDIQTQRANLEQAVLTYQGLVADLEKKLKETQNAKGLASAETPTTDAKPQIPSQDYRQGPTSHLVGKQEGKDSEAGQKKVLQDTEARQRTVENGAPKTRKRQQIRISQRMRNVKKAKAKNEAESGTSDRKRRGGVNASMGSHDGDDEDWILNESILGLGPSN